jgi:hypothetical protein
MLQAKPDACGWVQVAARTRRTSITTTISTTTCNRRQLFR